jgi:hypothetical protein
MFFLILIIFSVIQPQGLDLHENFYDRVSKEIKSIQNNSVSENLFLYPLKEQKKKSYYDFLNNSINNLTISPVLGIRISNSGYEINSMTPNPIIWISPGLNLSFNKVILNSLNPIWFFGDFSFSKHSAYGIKNDLHMETDNTFDINNDKLLFQYNPDISFPFYSNVKQSNGNGIDFDETLNYISILNKNFDITFGNFRSSLGPSFYSNLSISQNIPAFNQVRFYYKHKDKLFFSFITGDLYSGIIDSNIYYDETRSGILPKKFFNHRIDLKLLKNLRLGFYEQIIKLSSSPSFSYHNPISFYWSEQHRNGDVDNLQIGFDFDYIYKNNRFYGGLLIDEWSPYNTFSDHHHNWFAHQLGYSKIFNLKSNNSIIKIEISKAMPQVYKHKFEINDFTHHGYNLGLWSGGDSIDKRLNLIIFLDKYILDIGFNKTKIGEPKYKENLTFLSSEEIKIREYSYISFTKTIFSNIGFNFKVGYYNTENLYSDNNFIDVSTSLIYNIQN